MTAFSVLMFFISSGRMSWTNGASNHLHLTLNRIKYASNYLHMEMNMEQENSAGIQTEDTRRRIVRTALNLFGKIGYSSTTTRTIADAAGVNEVTLFRHFGSKKNLLMACMQSFNAGNFTSRFESELTGEYPRDILRMAKMQIEDTSENLDLLRLLVCDARNVPDLREAMDIGSRDNSSKLAAYFQKQLDAGIVRPDLSADELASLFDLIFSMKLFFDNVFQDKASLRLPDETELLRQVDFFVRGTQAER